MIHVCNLQNDIGQHFYLRGGYNDVYDYVDRFFDTKRHNEPIIIQSLDRDEDTFVHLMHLHPELYCEDCDVHVNSQSQFDRHIAGKKHRYNVR